MVGVTGVIEVLCRPHYTNSASWHRQPHILYLDSAVIGQVTYKFDHPSHIAMKEYYAGSQPEIINQC